MAEPALKILPTQKPIEPPPRKFWSFLPLSILFLSLAAICGYSYYWFSYLEKFVTTDDAYIEADFYPISTKVPGAVKQVLVREGTPVKKGEVLLLIDDSDFLFEKNFKQMKVEKAQLDFNRAQTLHRTRAISDFDFENAQASLKAAEVDRQGTEIKIGYTRILAPADGIVAKRSAQIGQVIQPGQSLFILVNNSEQWIKANFKETQLERLKIGQQVAIEIDGFPHHPMHGVLESIFPSSGAKLSILPPENSTGNFTRVVQRIPVKISIDRSIDPGFSLKPGMSVQVKVDTREPKLTK